MQLQADVNLQEFIDSVLLETTSFEENRKVRRIAVHTHTHMVQYPSSSYVTKWRFRDNYSRPPLIFEHHGGRQ